MFYVNTGEAMLPTALQVGDRIRVRPKLGLFFIWRPIVGQYWLAWFPILRVRRAYKLWMPRDDGSYHCWLELPSGKGDALHRILDTYGYEHFSSVNLHWSEEVPWLAVDGRFDYVARPRTIS